MDPLFLSAPIVENCLSETDVFRTVSETMKGLHDGSAVNGPKNGFDVDFDGVHLHVGSVSGGTKISSTAGIKWFAVAPDNPSRGLPRIPATIVLTNAQTGCLEGVLDGTQLTADRTAAMAVAASAACTTRPPRNAVVVGAGAIGKALVRYVTSTGLADTVTVVAPEMQLAEDAIGQVRPLLHKPVELSATIDARAAVADADVIFTATGVPTDSDLVCASWLKDDAIVCSLGSRREVDTELLSTAWLVVDDLEGVRLRRSDFRPGGVAHGRVAADVATLMSGKSTPPAGRQRIHLVLIGMGSLDIALGAQALVVARQKHLGVPLPR